ncbi:UNKNOWN [Stylonychia lemnae]|uniref:Uncharacterized protein n=1 Tax=Stylonychia lemnae TaxID=5949 RepID=A0A078A329_STYLE|nr:UNKNOWN [Stylonychia lemnae]|eukprot:CDW75903.1 UNKNOWN [Stylonychia lemnae]
MSADNRKLRVKHGAKLFEVLKDQESVNQQPLTLIETAIPNKEKQQQRNEFNYHTERHSTANIQHQNQSQVNYASQNTRDIKTQGHTRLNSNLSQKVLGINQTQNGNPESVKGLMLSEYIKDTRFNPSREISKERHITEFFQQKFMLLNEYLNDDNDDDMPQPIQSNVTTAIMRSRQKKKRRNIKRVQSVADLQQNQTKPLLAKKNRADQVIEQIERAVSNQVDKEWKHRYDAEAEQKALQQEIMKITEQSKRRVQMFVDPRSSRIRQNFKVLNQNLAEIRKLDPNMNLLSSVATKHRYSTSNLDSRFSIYKSSERAKTADWQHHSNAQILSEILKIGRN